MAAGETRSPLGSSVWLKVPQTSMSMPWRPPALFMMNSTSCRYMASPSAVMAKCAAMRSIGWSLSTLLSSSESIRLPKNRGPAVWCSTMVVMASGERSPGRPREPVRRAWLPSP